eukprot:4410296-Pyramimonas_sp.AAC.1
MENELEVLRQKRDVADEWVNRHECALTEINEERPENNPVPVDGGEPAVEPAPRPRQVGLQRPQPMMVEPSGQEEQSGPQSVPPIRPAQ